MILLGYLIYFTYGIRKSAEGALQKKEKIAKDIKTDGEFNRINRISIMPNEKTPSSKYIVTNKNEMKHSNGYA